VRKIVLIVVAISLAVFVPFGLQASQPRQLEFDYVFVIKDIPANISSLKVWVPYLPQKPYQVIEDVAFPLKPAQITEDKKYNNRIIFYSFESPKDPSITINVRYKVKRYEYSANPVNAQAHAGVKNSGTEDLLKYLKSDRLVAITPQIQEISNALTKDKSTVVEKARVIYDYVFDNVSYDKTIPGWGKGDVERVCMVRAGNCTDFHSLFIALCRAAGIPAKFVIGASIPKDKEEGEIKSYHCWAQFYDETSGWVPVDISEAWKHKEMRDYYFGSLGDDRLEFTEGRDIVLEPTQNEEPLNYFVFPYVEADGKVFTNVDASFHFKQKADERG